MVTSIFQDFLALHLFFLSQVNSNEDIEVMVHSYLVAVECFDTVCHMIFLELTFKEISYFLEYQVILAIPNAFSDLYQVSLEASDEIEHDAFVDLRVVFFVSYRF